MVIMMHLAGRKKIMGEFTIPPILAILGWLSTAVMTLAAGALIVSWFWR